MVKSAVPVYVTSRTLANVTPSSPISVTSSGSFMHHDHIISDVMRSKAIVTSSVLACVIDVIGIV